MTQSEWLASHDPDPMFHLLAGRADARRWRLFSSACLRELGHLLPDEQAREAFRFVEAWAERPLSIEELAAARQSVIRSGQFLRSSAFPRSALGRRGFARMQGLVQSLYLLLTTSEIEPESQAVAVAGVLRHADPHDPDWETRICQLSADLLRDLFGDPFGSIDLPPEWLAYQGREAITIAQAIYADRTFDELPILADALEDADCPYRKLVRHCREPGLHGRGCWVVDRLRGEQLVALG